MGSPLEGVWSRSHSLLGLVLFIKTHIKPIAEELIVEELVDDEDLRGDDHQVGGLARVEHRRVPVVLVVEMLLITDSYWSMLINTGL